MKVSVVIPLYNKRPYITRAVESVLAQNYPSFELIVIDDGSTDGGGGIVARYSDSRLLLIRQPNAGEGPARARGITEARGEYVAFLDADDEWLPGFLEAAVRLMEDFPAAAAGGLGYAIISPDGETRPARLTGLPDGEWRGILPDFFAAALDDPPLSSSSTIIRRDILLATQPAASRSNIGADQYLWCQLALNHPIAYDSARYAYYHQDAAQRALVVCRTEDELPFVTLLRDALRQGQFAFTTRASLCDFITFYEMSTVWRVLRHDGNPALARTLLARCRPSSRYWKAYARYWLETHCPPRMISLARWVVTHKKLTGAVALAAMLAALALIII